MWYPVCVFCLCPVAHPPCPLPPPPVFSLFSAPLDFRSVHPAVGRANCAWKRFNLMRATTRRQRPAQVSDIVCVGLGA